MLLIFCMILIILRGAVTAAQWLIHSSTQSYNRYRGFALGYIEIYRYRDITRSQMQYHKIATAISQDHNCGIVDYYRYIVDHAILFDHYLDTVDHKCV